MFLKDKNIKIKNLSPAPPSFFSNLKSEDIKDLSEYELFSFREYNHTHPVREKVPFCPTECICDIREKVYWLSNNEIIIEREI